MSNKKVQSNGLSLKKTIQIEPLGHEPGSWLLFFIVAMIDHINF